MIPPLGHGLLLFPHLFLVGAIIALLLFPHLFLVAAIIPLLLFPHLFLVAAIVALMFMLLCTTPRCCVTIYPCC